VTPHASDDFTIATQFETPDDVDAVAIALNGVGAGEMLVTRDDLDQELPPDTDLDDVEVKTLLVGLLLNDAAERADHVTPLIDASFVVDVERATTVLREQAAACAALQDRDPEQSAQQKAEFVATVPPQLDAQMPPTFGDLDTQVRSLLLTADNVARVANPYFDPGHPTVETLRTLPERGVETRILTRSVKPGTDRYDVLSAMRSTLSAAERELVDVSELFSLTDAGTQAYATHAKMIVADQSRCYVGSANFTTTNLSSNFEAGIITSGQGVPAAATMFDDVFKVGHRVSLPD
jgi:cardiolipin synthase/putative cardiolipin synthase